MPVVARKGCPECGSRDNVAVYDDGGEHCFTQECGYHVFGEGSKGSSSFTPTVSKIEMSGTVAAIKDRKLTTGTCSKYGVTVDYAADGTIANHYYPYYSTKTGEIVATKKRNVESKSFYWSGDRTEMGLFGQNKCSGRGKYLTITEGEIDALAVAEMFDNRYDVVSIPDGCQSARRALQAQLEWLEGYDSIVLCFDNDAAGQDGVASVRDLFSPNKLKIAELPMKDAGAMLVAGQTKDFVKSWWDAKSYSPAGIVKASETWGDVLEYRDTPSTPYPWAGLQEKLMGQRAGELVIWAAETGVGKSQTMREVIYHTIQSTDEKVGCLMLEESVAKSMLGWMSFHAGRPLHKELNDIPEEELRKYWEKASEGDRFVLLDHRDRKSVV